MGAADPGTGNVAGLAEFVAKRAPHWRSLLQELVRIPSTFECEESMVERVAAHVRELGLPVHTVRHDPTTLEAESTAQPPVSRRAGRHSLVVRVPGAGGGRSLVLNAHLDIVPAGDPADWSHPPFSGCA